MLFFLIHGRRKNLFFFSIIGNTNSIIYKQADKLQTLVAAAGVEVEPIWFSLYAKALAGQDLKALLLNVGAPGSGPAVAAGGAGAAAGAEAPAEEEKVEEKEESDDDMGFGKF
jgi:large subunit ribosomal protein LP1